MRFCCEAFQGIYENKMVWKEDMIWIMGLTDKHIPHEEGGEYFVDYCPFCGFSLKNEGAKL